MTKHKFVKLVWNMNDRIWQKSAGNRLFRAAYTPIDRRLFRWCLKRAPLFSLISSCGGASQTCCVNSGKAACIQRMNSRNVNCMGGMF